MSLSQKNLIPASEISAALSSKITELCHILLPNGKKIGQEWRAGSLSGEPGQSLGVHLSGAKAGLWADFSTSEKGDALNLIAECLYSGNLKEAYKWALSFLGLSDGQELSPEKRREFKEKAQELQEQASQEHQKKRNAARAMWHHAKEISANSPAYLYFLNRGINLENLAHFPKSLRFSVEHQNYEKNAKIPAILAAIFNENGEQIATHQTFIERNSEGNWVKANLQTPKKILGAFSGGYIALSRGSSNKPLKKADPDDVIMIGEGIETTLSAALFCPHLRALSACSLGNIGQIFLPPQIKKIIILAENDQNPTAKKTLLNAIQALKTRTIEVRLAFPPSKNLNSDFNDSLQDPSISFEENQKAILNAISAQEFLNTLKQEFQQEDQENIKENSQKPPPPPQNIEEENPEKPFPVVTLGQSDGAFYFLDAVQQLRRLTANSLEKRAEIVSLFAGDINFLQKTFPHYRFNKETGSWEIVDFARKEVSDYLIKNAFNAGMFGDHILIRKPGIWGGFDGHPLVHCGDAIFTKDKIYPPGLRIGNQIFPAFYSQKRPDSPATARQAGDFYYQIETLWNFKKNGSGIILIGWLACAYLGASIPWRPALFLTGSAGAGKSSLLNILHAACPLSEHTTNTSKAGLEQKLNGRAMPTFIDEAVDGKTENAARMLLDLVLASASGEGSKALRGTSDGAVRENIVVGSIAMAAITPPDMQAQHYGRFTLVELTPASQGNDFGDIHRNLISEIKKIGANLWGRMLQNFTFFKENALIFRTELKEKNCSPREIDQLSSLLAGFYTLTQEAPLTHTQAAYYVNEIQEYIQGNEQALLASETQDLADILLTQRVQVNRSSDQRSIISLIQTILKNEPNPTLDDQSQQNIAADTLAAYGIRVIKKNEPRGKNGTLAPRGAPGAGLWLYPRSTPLKSLFKETPFAGQKLEYSLKRFPSSFIEKKLIKIGAMRCRSCIWLSASDLNIEDPPDPDPIYEKTPDILNN